jgi:hypothetical protein
MQALSWIRGNWQLFGLLGLPAGLWAYQQWGIKTIVKSDAQNNGAFATVAYENRFLWHPRGIYEANKFPGYQSYYVPDPKEVGWTLSFQLFGQNHQIKWNPMRRILDKYGFKGKVSIDRDVLRDEEKKIDHSIKSYTLYTWFSHDVKKKEHYLIAKTQSDDLKFYSETEIGK